MIVTSSKPKPGKFLAETHPELAAQADGWDPTTATTTTLTPVFVMAIAMTWTTMVELGTTGMLMAMGCMNHPRSRFSRLFAARKSNLVIV